MKQFIWTGLLLLAIVPVAGIFAVLVWFANEWVVSVLTSAAVLAWLCGWLVVAYGKGRVRAAAIGAVVAGAAYWLLAMGPWFQANIGSTLLTSRLLAWVEATHRQPAQPTAVNAVFTTLDLGSGGYVAANTLVSSSGATTAPPQYVVTTIPQGPLSPPAVSLFQLAGHWSFAWLCALAGGALAAFLQEHRSGESRQNVEAAV
jgi:hypothetical protein